MTTETAEKNLEETLRNSHIIESDTFKPTYQSIGYGCWGKVDLYEDIVGGQWAIKYFSPNETARKQMQERGWTEERVMRDEAISLDAAQHHVAPRIIERDKTGKIFVAMPYYEDGNLSGRIKRMETREILEVGKDIADGLRYLHTTYGNKLSWKELREDTGRRAHGDVKPSNILMSKGRAFLSDLGSSTCITIGGEGSQRGPYGDVNYRAPKAFDEDAKPSCKADVWSLGAIIYEGIAKEGIYEGVDPTSVTQKEINRKIRKNIPRNLRRFLKKCLAVEESKRFYNGEEVYEKLEGLVNDIDGTKALKNHVKKWGLSLGLPAVILGFLAYAGSTYEPQKLEMPKIQRVNGILYPPGTEDTTRIQFEDEQIDSLPEAYDLGGMIGGDMNGIAKRSTDNRIVAYLAKTHGQASRPSGMLTEPLSEKMWKVYMAYTTPDERTYENPGVGRVWPAIAKNIEVALTQSETKDGKVDLEDVMAITRCGIETVDKAKRVSKSLNYKEYRNAVDEKGDLIIPKNERKMIDNWLAYYYADVD